MSWIKEVRLENFMSYDYARIPLKKGVNLIVGPNGSGKSSILLAISLAFGQLYTERSKKLSDLIKWGKDAARVSLIIDNSRSGGRRPFAFSNSDVIMVSRYIKNDGSYWYEIDYREASLYEVQNIFKRIGINPSNMLIIMHQNTLERFSALKDPEKLSLLEDAVGLSGHRNRIVDSETKLSSVESEESSVETEIEHAEETLGYWKTMYEKYTRRKALNKKREELDLELGWARVMREEKSLEKIEEEKEKKEKSRKRLLKRIEKDKLGVDSAQTGLYKYKDPGKRVEQAKKEIERYVETRVNLALDEFKKSLIDKEIKEIEKRIREATEKIESIMPQGARLETQRGIKEIEEDIESIKRKILNLGEIAENCEEMYMNFAEEFKSLGERGKTLEENRKKTLEELNERKQLWNQRIQELINGVEPRYRKILKEFGGDGHIAINGSVDEIEECGLETYVGFKGIEPRVLDSLTQSGGERAAATMAFLLALQQNIKSKFRAVDEFDVHMDTRNRERIYGIIMRSVKEGEQYLIITPSQVAITDRNVNAIIVQTVHGASKVAGVS